MDDVTYAVMPPDPEMIQVGDAIWQRPQWRGLVQRSVRPVGVVEVLVLPRHHHQVALVPDQRRTVGPFSECYGQPFHGRIHSRCLNGGADDSDPGRLEHGIERLREAGVPVMQDEFRSCPGLPSSMSRVRACWTTQDWTGCSVAPRTRTRRLPCSITARTYAFVPLSRSAVKSLALGSPAPGTTGTPPSQGRPSGAPGRSRRH